MASLTHSLACITLVIYTLSDAFIEENSAAILEATQAPSITEETSQNSTHISPSTKDTNLYFPKFSSKTVEDIELSRKSTTPVKVVNIEDHEESTFPSEVTTSQNQQNFQDSPSATRSLPLTVAERGLFQNLFLQKLGLTRPPTRNEVAKVNFSRRELYNRFPNVKGTRRNNAPRGYRRHSDKRLSFTGTGKCYDLFLGGTNTPGENDAINALHMC